MCKLAGRHEEAGAHHGVGDVLRLQQLPLIRPARPHLLPRRHSHRCAGLLVRVLHNQIRRAVPGLDGGHAHARPLPT
eukprot:COSAG04_NODE_11747_length_691_cov_1.182432_1_plen_76_part_10